MMQPTDNINEEHPKIQMQAAEDKDQIVSLLSQQVSLLQKQNYTFARQVV